MRKEPFAGGDYVHIVKRGVRGLPIVRDKNDSWRFLKLLKHCNGGRLPEHWEDEIETKTRLGNSHFDRPEHWPKQEPLVTVLAYTLMPNHFHLLLKEITPGGVAKFMQRLGNSMTGHFNLKYKEKGTLFQGAYKAKRISGDAYMRYVALYIMVKNVFELQPGGLGTATRDFETAYAKANQYPFSSFVEYTSAQVRPAQGIIDKELLGEMFETPVVFKHYAKEFMMQEKYLKKEIRGYLLE